MDLLDSQTDLGYAFHHFLLQAEYKHINIVHLQTQSVTSTNTNQIWAVKVPQQIDFQDSRVDVDYTLTHFLLKIETSTLNSSSSTSKFKTNSHQNLSFKITLANGFSGAESRIG